MIWGETTYRYDANGQVAESAFGDGFTEKFDYDSAKNVTGVKLQGPEIGFGLGGLLAWQSTPGGVVQLARGPNGETIALTHDVCGRVVTRRVDRKGFRPKTWTYGWDALDRLVTCETPEGDSWFYRYDPFGRRLTKVRKLREAELAWTAQKFGALVPEEAQEKTKVWTWPEPPNGARADDRRPPIVGTHFTWDGDVVAEEAPLRLDGSLDWADANRWHFEPGGFRPLAKQTPDGTLLHIVNDHLGTPKEMFDEGGGLRWAASFTTWGAVRGVRVPLEPANDDGRAIYPRGGTHGNLALKATPEEAALECPMKFQGQWADEETGLLYNRNRHYDPASQQYASSDPIGLAGGPRPQSYVKNPTVWIDPLGWAQRLQAATDQAVKDIKANPSIAKDLMTEGSYKHLVVNSRLAKASYGKAVERRAAQILEEDPTLKWAGKAPKGPDGKFIGGPDFTGSGGATYDITTESGISSHVDRSYGPTTTYIPHPGLPGDLVFPP